MMNKYSLADKFVIMAILTLPYDSIPHILPFIYRPLSLYFIAVAFVIYLLQDKLRFKFPKSTIRILVFFFISVSIGSIVLFCNTENLTALKYYVPSVSMGMITLITFTKFFTHNQSPDFSLAVLKFAGYAYIPAIIIGTIETLSCYHVLPFVVKSSINLVFNGGSFQSYRPMLVNSEAANAAIQMLFASSVYYCLSKIEPHFFWKKLLYWALLLLLLTVSTKGITMLFMTMFLFIVMNNFLNGNINTVIKKNIIYLTVFFVLFTVIWYLLKLSEGMYYSKRILEFSTIGNLLETDSSAFIRIGLPAIAIKMFFKHFMFGLGAGGFHIYALDYIREYASYAWNFHDVIVMRQQGYSMSVGLFFQLLANFGLYGLIIVGYSFKSIWLNLMRMKSSTECSLFLFSAFIVMFMFIGNWAYMPFWFLFAFFSCNKYIVNESFRGR